ncbi:MAG: chromosomal replication initiator protein DnaA [bacterium]
MNCEEVWTNVLEALRLRVSRQAYETWLAPTKLVSFTNGSVKVSVPNLFFVDWLKHHYLSDILIALKEITGRELAIEFVLPEERSKRTQTIAEPTPVPVSSAQFRLRSRYTFDTFIVGEGNRLAWAAAHNVAQNLGKTFNPLFIYGGVGLGKTHLLQAIGNACLGLYPGLKLCYTAAEALFLELIQAIGKNTRLEFKDKYRGLDLLLLDDVHYLVGKESLQEEIFFTFNALQDSGSQVVFTSDRPPKDIPTLQERLISRLGSGLVVDIQPPDLETRVAILMQKAKLEGLELSGTIALFIANRVRSNIRTLEAALVRLIALHSLTGKHINIELAEQALKDLVHPEQPIDGNSVISAVAEAFSLPTQELKGTKRTKRIALARQVAMYLMRNVLNLSLKDIGFYFGGKDHTTVLHAINKITELKDKDGALSGTLNRLTKQLQCGTNP